ncbi:MAG: membrane dipeptidase [Myxococcota bacterium]
MDPGMIEIDNWGFEHGLNGWTKTGNAFDHQPTYGDNVKARRVMNGTTRYRMPLGGDYWKELSFPIGHKGNRWIGTFEKRPNNATSLGGAQGDGKTGTLTSRTFKINDNFITFLVGGGRDLTKLKVELLVKQSNGSFRVLSGSARTGQNHELLRREWWDVTAQRGKTAKIRITDSKTGGWGHINVDDFRFQAKSPSKTIMGLGGLFKQASMFQFRKGDANARGYVDWDAPVFGLADLHTHPASHLGFGKKVMYGSPAGDIKKLSNCNPVHGGHDLLHNQQGNYLRAMVVGMLDAIYMHKTGLEGMDHPREGYPHFKHWPTFTTVTHQQMHRDWIKRAHEGGLKVMVGLAVNNHLLAAAVDGDAPHDDRESANAQIRFMKSFVRHNASFMEVATDPAQMRRIIREGKLAVILGIEVDNLGNFNFISGVDRSNDAVRNEIRRLHRMGVRYIFPIHVTDNAFGGAAVYSEMFNLANRFAAVQPLPASVGAWAPGTSFSIEHAPDKDVKYRLAPVLPEAGAAGILGAIMAFEAAPSPAAGVPFGVFLNAEPEYQVIKNFFLVPDPKTMAYRRITPGHRNKQGLKAKGRVAVKEMMNLGMIIDIDHASEKAVDDILEIAEGVSGGYPLVSGHNGFRPMRAHASENQRSDSQVRRLMQLDGMMGVAWGYEKNEGTDPTFASVIRTHGGRAWTKSNVAATCGGSSRRFIQEYLYGLEHMGGAHVALGSDINGLFPGPGPRFGAFKNYDGNRCNTQNKAVTYQGGVLTRHAEHGNLSSSLKSRLGGSNNTPLKRLKTGTRQWDVNLDGVAHYGLLPDFLQDLDNVGLHPDDMTPLFHSAEHLARTWTKALENAPKSKAKSGGAKPKPKTGGTKSGKSSRPKPRRPTRRRRRKR